ncbi:MAG: hypothetical protein U9N57_01245 [Pseudomonadota bacterium]|nr:hypothetical protein [Pseudomonadota bacterium]
MSWKNRIEEKIREDRVFSTAEIVNWGKDKLEISERSIKSFMAELHNDGEILTVHKGLYTSFDPKKPVRLQEVLRYVSPQATVSLDSVFNDQGTTSIRGQVNGDKGAVYAIVPINDSNNPPKVGEIKTQMGNIRVFSVNQKLFSTANNLDSAASWRQHLPESAVAFAISLDGNSRSKYTLDNHNEFIHFPKIDIPSFVQQTQELGISPDLVSNHLARFKPEQQQPLVSQMVQSEQNLQQQKLENPSTPKISR